MIDVHLLAAFQSRVKLDQIVEPFKTDKRNFMVLVGNIRLCRNKPRHTEQLLDGPYLQKLREHRHDHTGFRSQKKPVESKR